MKTPQCMHFLNLIGWLIGIGGLPGANNAAEPPVALFDGKSLKGWRGNPDHWRVEGGVIIGSTKPAGRTSNTFLIANGDYRDFVLRAQFRLIDGASGIQFRSQPIGAPEAYRVKGYQADIGGGDTGTFYEEKGRGTLVGPNHTVLDAHYRPGEWNTYEITMQGHTGELKINGHRTARYTETDPSVPRSGVIALQLQAGDGMEIHFKDIEIQELNSEAAASLQRPNIILIMADDLGFSDLGCYGSEIHTPHIDRLATHGLRFTQFYNNAKCAPSRASLLSGLYPQQIKDGTHAKGSLNLAQVLQSAGYRTWMTGRSGGLADTPVRSGFDHFFGLLSACCNYFNPGLQRDGEPPPGRKYPEETRPWGRDDQVLQPFTPTTPDFYATDAFTETALDYLDTSQAGEPFFLYLPFTAPHFPIQARPEDIEKYRGTYQIGWDKLREQRYRRQVELGIVKPDWTPSPRDPLVAAWDSLTEEERDRWDRNMAVYAAMIDRMDQGIGQILSKLRQLGIEDNTLILFLSDNGACAEDYRGFDATASDHPPGPMASYRTQDLPWANASNTPFRKYKWWLHEGGIASPLIAYWPGRIAPGGFTDTIAHIMDIMPTCLDIAGVPYPKTHQDTPLMSLEGKSLWPLLQGQAAHHERSLFWQFGQCRAVRHGKWKLVAGHSNPRLGIDYFQQRGSQAPNWELYDMESDRTEQNDLATHHPDRVAAMSELFEDWSQRVSRP